MRALTWSEEQIYDRGKIMTYEDSRRQGVRRYLDVDGDAIPYRTLPGTHPTKGLFYTRHVARPLCQVQRRRLCLRRQHAAPAAQARDGQEIRAEAGRAPRQGSNPLRAIYFGSTSPAMAEALVALESQGHPPRHTAPARLSVPDEVIEFVNAHDQIFIVEQNRDALMQNGDEARRSIAPS